MFLFVNNFLNFRQYQLKICITDNHFALLINDRLIIDNRHTYTKSCLNFRIRKGPSDEQGVFDLKDLLSPSEKATITAYYSARDLEQRFIQWIEPSNF